LNTRNFAAPAITEIIIRGDHLSGKPGNTRNLTAVREMSGILLKSWENVGEKSCQGKVA